ncbi:MAG: V-type ATP synthase subunit F [bacterium]
MSKIAFIGDKASILGFKAIGADIFSVTDPDGENGRSLLLDILENTLKGDYKIIYITEDLASQILDYLNGIDKLWPIITIIPGLKGSRGLGKARLRNYIIKATGTDMIV